MRPIDADALKVNIEQAEDETYETTGYIMHMSDSFAIIDNAPTIDAIPVDWLREKMRGYASALKSTELDAVVRVLRMWEEEQE